jgi:hypothetical protein
MLFIKDYFKTKIISKKTKLPQCNTESHLCSFFENKDLHVAINVIEILLPYCTVLCWNP